MARRPPDSDALVFAYRVDFGTADITGPGLYRDEEGHVWLAPPGREPVKLIDVLDRLDDLELRANLNV